MSTKSEIECHRKESWMRHYHSISAVGVSEQCRAYLDRRSSLCTIMSDNHVSVRATTSRKQKQTKLWKCLSLLTKTTVWQFQSNNFGCCCEDLWDYVNHSCCIFTHRVKMCMQSTRTYLYTKYRGVHGIWGCTQSTGNVHGIQKCIRIYAEYKLLMIYDTESPQPYPFTISLLSIQFSQNLIIPGGLENQVLHNTSHQP